jgi:hypothetical protein
MSGKLCSGKVVNYSAEYAYQDLSGLSIDDLARIINDLKREESYTNPNNGRKFLTIKRLEAEKLLENLQSDN